METLGDKNMPKLCAKFTCSLCSYNTNKKSSYDNHINSKKHKMVTNGYNKGHNYAKNMPNDLETFTCDCGKHYLHRQGLWRHKKNSCNMSEHPDEQHKSKEKIHSIDKDQLILMILKQNSEIIKEQSGIKEIILEIVKNGTMNNSHNTTTNSHNKAFNLQFFLNETCKNAMNITDFVDTIKLQLSDFMSMGDIGFVEGISNIIVKNLNSLDETIRPIHCTEQKRETFYVKHENTWEKEEKDKKRIKNMIRGIAYKNEKLIKVYKETYPDYNNPESRRSDQYSKIMIETMDSKNESREKIIKNISKVTTVAKTL